MGGHDHRPRDPLHLFDANIFYPEPRTLAFSEIMLPQALLGAPLTWAGADPVLVYNLLVIAGFALSGFAMAWLVSRWTGDRAAGVVAGLAYAFNAHMLVRFGHLQAMHVQYLPVALFALQLTIETPRPRWVLLAGARAGAAVVDVELPAGDVGDRDDRGRRRAPGGLAAATSFARSPAAGAPREPGAGAVPLSLLAGRTHGRGWSARSMKSRVTRRRGATGWRREARCTTRGGAASGSVRAPRPAFPGFTVALLALVCLVRGEAWRDPARANGAGGRRRRGDAGVRRQPARLSRALRAGAHPERHPCRLAVWLADALCASDPGGLHARGVEAPARPPCRRALVAVAAALLVTVEALRAPMTFTIYEGIPRIYDRVAAMDGIVLAECRSRLASSIKDNGPSVLYSAWHLKPLLNGYSGFTPASYPRTYARSCTRFPSSDSVRIAPSHRCHPRARTQATGAGRTCSSAARMRRI